MGPRFLLAFATEALLTTPLFCAAPAIIPAPSKMELGACTFHLDKQTALIADPEFEGVAGQLRDALAPATGFSFDSHVTPAKAGAQTTNGSLDSGLLRNDEPRQAILLRLDPKLEALGDEGYRLDVQEHRVIIRAKAAAGAFYAVQTLLQLLPHDVFRRAPAGRKDWPAPCVKIEDRPRFAWRGMLLDVGRHFMPKPSIFRFLDLMALYKLNTFHWHLTDDSGWRIEIKKYPRLTQIASRMDHSSMNPDDATRSPSVTPGGFYTQDDIREIVRYAAQRGITIVPEIEMPGHAGAAIFAYPQLGNRWQIEEAGGDASFLGNNDNVFNADDSTIAFLKDVLDEVMALFPGPFVHIGGDEVWKEPWKRNPRVQQRMKALGLRSEEEMQSWFIKQLDAYLTSKGRRLMGWDEILEGGLAPGAAVTSWRGVDGGIAAAQAGHDVVMNPSGQTYLDYYQSKPIELEPKAIADYYLPLDQVYKFDPVPPQLTPEQAKHVLGGQAAVWGEYIPDIQHAEYMMMPRMQAFAETVWSPQGARDYADFIARLKEHTAKLDAMGAHYRALRPDPEPLARWTPGELGTDWIEREWPLGAAIPDSGDYKVLIHGAKIEWIEILEDGRSLGRIDKPYAPGGGNNWPNLFMARVQVHSGSKYTLRARIKPEGTNVPGDVYVVPAVYPSSSSTAS